MSAATPGCRFGSQGADISAIPAIGIKNLQVLRDGATAQYGSDAIAGVMNFGMRNDRNNLELQARYGQTFDHGHTKLDSGRSRQIAGTAGIGIGATGFIDVAGEWYKDDGTSTGETRPVALLFAQEFPQSSRRSCLTIRCQCKSGARRRPTAGRAWSTPASTSPTTASSISPASALTATRTRALIIARQSPGPLSMSPAITHTFSAQRRILGPILPDALPGRQRDLRRPAAMSRTTTPSCSPTSIRPGFTPRFVGISKERWGTAGWQWRVRQRTDVGPVGHAGQEHADLVDE